ncbi:DUF2063 domain-containing protein [Methylomonas sp. HYX-M1]|uniref:HvfC/BufC N-terminal domain-containing protein n=1 Tax=Methylomonas sp. HYX-M1 TaxID=3139307 RepID=UPI00345B759F
MNRLLELQREVSRQLLTGISGAADGIVAAGFTPQQRLSIYRNNTLTGLTESLRAVYPVVDKLVGKAFFDRAAREFIQSRPPRAASLIDYGRQFSDWLVVFPGLEQLPYLPDTARLEWAWHQACHAADAGVMDLTVLLAAEAQSLGRAAFKLHPSARFLSSPYPIDQIWQCNQPGAPLQTVDWRQGACHLLLFRQGEQVLICPLAAAEYQFLLALSLGWTLVQATIFALGCAADFDVHAALQRWMPAGLWVECLIH